MLAGLSSSATWSNLVTLQVSEVMLLTVFCIREASPQGRDSLYNVHMSRHAAHQPFSHQHACFQTVSTQYIHR